MTVKDQYFGMRATECLLLGAAWILLSIATFSLSLVFLFPSCAMVPKLSSSPLLSLSLSASEIWVGHSS